MADGYLYNYKHKRYKSNVPLFGNRNILNLRVSEWRQVPLRIQFWFRPFAARPSRFLQLFSSPCTISQLRPRYQLFRYWPMISCWPPYSMAAVSGNCQKCRIGGGKSTLVHLYFGLAYPCHSLLMQLRQLRRSNGLVCLSGTDVHFEQWSMFDLVRPFRA